ncbi:leucine-rich repeat-containing protein 26 [Varanus komodoensis]|uniref:leucine-rich repeat-containing protein 26 n=1 Tax=Varanus komodoensis TaxID=61221 RepID=UPI001CF799E5|nr:leucine-rich repeat-containing protein 26 [Varanus komodoensis]
MAWRGRDQRAPWPASGGSRPGGPCGPWRRLLFTVALVCPLPAASGCPDVCLCSSGEVNCVEHRLRFVPPDLPANATSILLDYNHIAALQNHTFVAQGALRRLSLRSNALACIHPQALAGLGQLQELDLSGNYLSALPPEAFLPVPALIRLDLGHNRLQELKPELLGALPRLRDLSVHGNALASVWPGTLESLPALRRLKLDGNPWACSCGIQPLFQWLVSNADKVPEVNAVSCQRPASLAQHPIAAISNASFARCQEAWLRPRDYAVFLFVGPAAFLASICFCVLLGSLAVARERQAAMSYIRPGALARRAERSPRQTPPQLAASVSGNSQPFQLLQPGRAIACVVQIP